MIWDALWLVLGIGSILVILPSMLTFMVGVACTFERQQSACYHLIGAGIAVTSALVLAGSLWTLDHIEDADPDEEPARVTIIIDGEQVYP